MMRFFIMIIAVFTANVNDINAQNLIMNSDFETGGQLNCSSWFDPCDNELTFLCDTITPDTTCNVMFYQDAPP